MRNATLYAIWVVIFMNFVMIYNKEFKVHEVMTNTSANFWPFTKLCLPFCIFYSPDNSQTL